MAKKRMTDTEIWDKEWFMELTPKLKCLMRYLFDRCDASGMWKPNWKLASLHVGETVSMNDVKQLPCDQYEIIGGKIFLPGFISFQYGKLSEASPAHKPIFKAIEENNLSDRVFNRVSDTLQEKEKEKEIEKEIIKDRGTGKGKLIDPAMPIPPNVLEAAEQNQWTHHQQRNTDFIKGLWKTFLMERVNDPPAKRRPYELNASELYQYFLNWSRNKFPKKSNGTHIKSSSKSSGANELLSSLKGDLGINS